VEPALRALFHHGAEQAFLALEVPVDRARGQTRAATHFRDAGAREAALAHQRRSGVEDAPARFGALLFLAVQLARGGDGTHLALRRGNSASALSRSMRRRSAGAKPE